jgi:hypothetical protein
MSLSLSDSQAITEISALLYDYLPGKPHPYANQDISFGGVAGKLGLLQFWSGGSKLPALTLLLQRTLEFKRQIFCDLILEIVRNGMIYRKSKVNPITKEEILKLNELIIKVNFKIPDLWNPKFLDGLPSNTPKPHEKSQPNISILDLKQNLLSLTSLQPQARGYAFEKFLNSWFELSHLAPKSSFRLVGEQIDGSFEIGTDVYLVEAKWQ